MFSVFTGIEWNFSHCGVSKISLLLFALVQLVGSTSEDESTRDSTLTIAKIYKDCYTKGKTISEGDYWGCVGVGGFGDDTCLRSKSCHFVLAYKRQYPFDPTGRTTFAFRLLDDAVASHNHSDKTMAKNRRRRRARHEMEFKNRYVTVGFSRSDKMGEDLVVSCVSHDENQYVSLSYNYNRQNGQQGNKPLKPHLGHVKPSQKAIYGRFIKEENGKLHCSFTLDARLTVVKDNHTGQNLWDGLTFDLATNSYYILLASGKSIGRAEISYHLSSRYWTDEGVDLSRIEEYYIPFDRKPGILASKIHIVFMVTSYVALLPSASLIARFYKESRQKTRLCYRRIWFIFHIFMMIIGALAVIVANILIGVYIGSFKKLYYKGIHAPLKTVKFRTHYLLGVFATAGFVINVTLGVYLSFSASDRGLCRIVVGFIHWFVGVFAYTLAMIQLFLAPFLLPDHVDWCTYPSIIVIVWVVLHVSVYMYLTLVLFKRDKLMNEMERREKEKLKLENLNEQFGKESKTGEGEERENKTEEDGNLNPEELTSQAESEEKEKENPLKKVPSSGSAKSKMSKTNKKPGTGTKATSALPKKSASNLSLTRKTSQMNPNPKASNQNIVIGNSVKPRVGQGNLHKPDALRQNDPRHSNLITPDVNKIKHEPTHSGSTASLISNPNPNPNNVKAPPNAHKISLKNKILGKFRVKPQTVTPEPIFIERDSKASLLTPSQTSSTPKEGPKTQGKTLISAAPIQLSVIKPNPKSVPMKKRILPQRKKSKKPKLKDLKNLNLKMDPDLNSDLDLDVEGQIEGPGQDGGQRSKSITEQNAPEGEEREKVVQILRKNRKKTNPFMYIDQFEVTQLAIRYEEKKDVKRAFRSFPLRMDFFLENPHTVRIEVILSIFFLFAVATTCLLCYELFPPKDQRRGQCEDETGSSKWMVTI